MLCRDRPSTRNAAQVRSTRRRRLVDDTRPLRYWERRRPRALRPRWRAAAWCLPAFAHRARACHHVGQADYRDRRRSPRARAAGPLSRCVSYCLRLSIPAECCREARRPDFHCRHRSRSRSLACRSRSPISATHTPSASRRSRSASRSIPCRRSPSALET